MPQNKVSSTTTHVTLNTINNVVLCSNKIESQKLKETATNMINKIVSQGQSIMRLLVGSFVISNSKSTSSLQLLRMPDLKKKLWLNLVSCLLTLYLWSFGAKDCQNCNCTAGLGTKLKLFQKDWQDRGLCPCSCEVAHSESAKYYSCGEFRFAHTCWRKFRSFYFHFWIPEILLSQHAACTGHDS